MTTKPAIVTCALTGVLTDPDVHGVPVTPHQMAASAREAFDAGATIMHCHFRQQSPGMGRFPTWDPDVCSDIVDAIRAACPGVIIHMSTGVVGPDIQPVLAAMARIKPEMAALNAGSLNYLKIKSNGEWAWPPMLFDNPVDKVRSFAEAMQAHSVIPECECFDTGILRSVGMFVRNGMIPSPAHVSLVMGVASGMPAKAHWLPLLIDEMLPETQWQVIAIGRDEIWHLHREAARLGGHLRTGLEDTFYLPNGSQTKSNGALVDALVTVARQQGREIASVGRAREMLGLN